MPTGTQPTSLDVAETGKVADRTFARNGPAASPRLAWFLDGLAAALTRAGYEARPTPGPDVQVVLHAVEVDAARPYRRRRAPTFVVALAALPTRRPTCCGSATRCWCAAWPTSPSW